MEKKTSNDLANYRLERAKLDLADAELLFQENSLLSANNRAYYAIFHALRAVLATARIDFKKHKDVIAYFNQYYVKTEIFPKIISKKISIASRTREDSDYDDEYIADASQTQSQIESAQYIIKLVEEYLQKLE